MRSTINFGDLDAWIRAQYAATGSKVLAIQPYEEVVTFSAIAQNATATQTINIQANADFVIASSSSQSFAVASALTTSTAIIPQARVLVTDTGSNQQFSQTAVPLAVMFPPAEVGEDISWCYPRFVSGRSSLQIQVTNLAAAALTCDLVFSGVLVYSNAA